MLQADPDFVPGLTNLFSILLCAERFEDARKLIPRIIETIGTPPSSYGSYAAGYAAVGDSVNARKFLEEARRVEGKQYFSRVDTAMAHYYLGETDLAFEWLDEAVEQKDSGVCSLKVDPTYDPLRADPRFAAILKRIGLGEGTL